MIRYLNLKSVHGKETVDQLDSKDFPSYSMFRKEMRELLKQTAVAYQGIGTLYWSQRACK